MRRDDSLQLKSLDDRALIAAVLELRAGRAS